MRQLWEALSLVGGATRSQKILLLDNAATDGRWLRISRDLPKAPPLCLRKLPRQTDFKGKSTHAAAFNPAT